MTPSPEIRDIGRRQLDRRFERLRGAMADLSPPRRGWINTLRTALGMRQADLAARLGMTKQALGQLERREVEGGATLKALQQVARALDGELVYAIIPRRSIVETLEKRASGVAWRMAQAVRHSMRLEDQETNLDLERRARELARELLRDPARLWSLPDAE